MLHELGSMRLKDYIGRANCKYFFALSKSMEDFVLMERCDVSNCINGPLPSHSTVKEPFKIRMRRPWWRGGTKEIEVEGLGASFVAAQEEEE